jgi:protein-tyrosine phosphatase
MNHAKVTRYIWIGNIDAPKDQEFLKSNNITFILNVSDYDIGNTSIHAPIMDVISLKESFGEIKSQVEHCIHLLYKHRGGNILVCCIDGVNRSAFCIATYLIYYEAWGYKHVIFTILKANKNRNLLALENPIYIYFLQNTLWRSINV